MSSDEIEQKEEEQPPKEEIPVPLYFDRYITSELRALGDRIVDLKESMDERFAQVDERFAQVDERFVQFEKHIDERFVQFEKRIDERFVQFDRRFVELKESVDKQFDKSDATLKWTIGLFSPVIVGILAIIVKMFFGP